jgi:hypothetical protein
MRVTRALIDDGRSRNGGWSREQAALLGVPWPLRPGWKYRVVGTEIPDEAAARFLELRDAHLAGTSTPDARSKGTRGKRGGPDRHKSRTREGTGPTASDPVMRDDSYGAPETGAASGAKPRRRCPACKCPVYARPGESCLYCRGPLSDPAARLDCQRCGPVAPILSTVTFVNGDTHRRAECPRCRKLIRYVPKRSR